MFAMNLALPNEIAKHAATHVTSENLINIYTTYSLILFLAFRGEALSRAELPAGPLNFDLSFGDVTFSKISPIFGIMPAPILQEGFF